MPETEETDLYKMALELHELKKDISAKRHQLSSDIIKFTREVDRKIYQDNLIENCRMSAVSLDCPCFCSEEEEEMATDKERATRIMLAPLPEDLEALGYVELPFDMDILRTHFSTISVSENIEIHYSLIYFVKGFCTFGEGINIILFGAKTEVDIFVKVEKTLIENA